MSNLDVQVLKSFTRKLAFAAKQAAPVTLMDQLGAVRDAALDFGSGAPPGPKPPVPNIDRKLQPPTSPPAGLSVPPKSEPDLGPGIGLPTGEEPGITYNPKTKERNPTPQERMDSLLPSPQVRMGLEPPAEPLPAAETGSMYDTLMGALPYAGGAAAGGLGAMALARLFNSSKDDEEESSWAPWLTGLAGAGLGAGAVHYNKQIADMIKALAGSAGIGGGDTAPAAVSAPAQKA